MADTVTGKALQKGTIFPFGGHSVSAPLNPTNEIHSKNTMTTYTGILQMAQRAFLTIIEQHILIRGSMLKYNYFKEFQTRAAAIDRPSYFFKFQAWFHREMK